jgi:hypothetical protein
MTTAFLKSAFVVIVGSVVLAGCDSHRAEDLAARYDTPKPESYAAATFSVRSKGADETLHGARVSEDFFREVGAQPLLGRWFMPSDYTGEFPVVAVSYTYWKTRLGAAPSIIGTTIDVDGKPATIVGVAPIGLDTPDAAMLWIPRAK